MSRVVILLFVYSTLGLSLLLAWLGLVTLRENLMGWFLLVSGLIYFFGGIVVYWIRGIRFWHARAKGEVLKEERDDVSFWFIVAGMVAVFYLPPFEYLLVLAILPRIVWMQVTGLLIILVGSILFIWARRVLGYFYSGHLSVIEGQPLVQHGPYRFIRHPAYAGYILIALGLSLGYSSLAGLVAILFLLLPSVVYRLRVEDRLLAEHFGEAFTKYTNKTKCLIPGIW